jgi:hypothetical protein
MDQAEQDRRVAAMEAHQQAVRDAVPEGLGLVLNERELLAVGLIVAQHAALIGEDILGSFLITSGGCLINSEERCLLAKKLEEADGRARQSMGMSKTIPFNPEPPLPR